MIHHALIVEVLDALVGLVLVQDGHPQNVIFVVLVHVAELVGGYVFYLYVALLDDDFVVPFSDKRLFLRVLFEMKLGVVGRVVCVKEREVGVVGRVDSMGQALLIGFQIR